MVRESTFLFGPNAEVLEKRHDRENSPRELGPWVYDLHILPSYRCSIDTQGHPGRSLALTLSMMRTSSRTSRELCHRWLRSQTTLVDSWASHRLGVTLRKASGYTDIYSVQVTLISCTMLPGDRTSTTLDHALTVLPCIIQHRVISCDAFGPQWAAL